MVTFEENQSEKIKNDLISLGRFSVYYLKKSIDQWIKLPSINSKQIRQSRGIDYFFTGNPEDTSLGNKFQGNEGEFLACQVIRIICSNYLFPSGLLQFNEETQKIEKNFDEI